MAPTHTESRPPGLIMASTCFAGVVLLIAFGLFVYGIDLHSIMFLCLLWTGGFCFCLGHDFTAIREMMAAAIVRALPAIYIFILIGMVIASFMHSGTIAALMYYGLNWISPALFLPLGMLLCAIMSVATGTSWGTVGTLGVVFIGIGSAMNIPLPLVAGMIVCGATFGDKMSPVSDTTNLAAMSAGTNLYHHIYAMLFTTLPTFILALIIFAIYGVTMSAGDLPTTEIGAIQLALENQYTLMPLITLLPIVLMLVLSVKRVPAEIAMSASILLAVMIAVILQGDNLALVLNALWSNSAPATGIPNLDDLLGRGGIYSMSWTLILALMALALGGLLHGSGILEVLLRGIVARVKSSTALVATTMGSGLLGNMAMGEAYISIILNCQLFKARYKAQKLDSAMLSRSVEEGSTLTTGLIPWTTAGAFYTATLGVPVLDYLPYAFFNYLNAPLAIAMAGLGWGVLRQSQTQVGN